ncbi:putative phage tail assembly chaperone [Photobacterium sp. TY1-4]|uniref:putative phage tail assembly chaperone n=1 Tax=Photobacterium sp. TY1-4 TaxID=2899122 RepID=UPI0021BECF75|nr:putative phage tail assembly chaperone [Photobacterium sp. TY1-4]UXI00429.1 putative phage tail assembly chaperone [Photobacterium sp. TY1-4]
MTQQKIITLEIAGKELQFEPTEAAYNDYMNELLPDNKVAPANNFLFSVVTDESKEPLREITKSNAGAAVQITSVVLAEFTPQMEIKVKK